MNNSFDRVAWIYDRLAHAVFGSGWQEVQLAPVREISHKKSVLIVGGGSGRLLEKLEGTEVTYVELSEAMIEQAQHRACSVEVDFIHANYLKWKTTKKFEAVLFPFFLDTLSDDHLREALGKVKDELARDGSLLVMDFKGGNPIQKALIRVMYLFFRLSTGLEAKRLTDFDALLRKEGFKLIGKQTFYRGWIFYNIYGLD